MRSLSRTPARTRVGGPDFQSPFELAGDRIRDGLVNDRPVAQRAEDDEHGERGGEDAAPHVVSIQIHVLHSSPNL